MRRPVLWTVAGAAVLAAITGGVVGSRSGAAAPPAPAATRSADAVVHDAILAALHAAWNPRLQREALVRARAERERLQRELAPTLSDAAHPRLVEALALAAALELHELRPLVVLRIADASDAARRAAFTAADALAPWADDELEEFLTGDDAAVTCAALECAAAREAPPLDAIAGLFAHGDRRVRDAAVRAFPATAVDGAHGTLLHVARHGNDDAAACAITVLARSAVTAEMEEALLAQLERSGAGVRLEALAALATKGAPLDAPDRVYRIAASSDEPLATRAAALFCIERTRSFEQVAELDRMTFGHPLLAYFGARCLISAGERRGLEGLIDAQAEGAPSGDDLAAPAHEDGARLLARLTSTSVTAGADAWRAWLAATDYTPPQELRPPGFDALELLRRRSAAD